MGVSRLVIHRHKGHFVVKIKDMEDYIFVEGKRYISAKQASKTTGYTSDYIGQMAREGRLNSKKIGRVRFVSEDQLKSYTVDSDRKKQAVEQMSMSQEREPTETVPKNAPSKPESKGVINIESDDNQDKIVVGDSTPLLTGEEGNPEKEIQKETTKKDSIDFGKVIHKTSATVSNTIKNIDLKETRGKVIALALTLVIVFGPYVSSKTGILSELVSESTLAYEAVRFDIENIAIGVYDKTKNEGVMRLVTDSLAFSEAELKDSMASAIFAFAEATGFIKKVPREILDNGPNLDIAPSTKALKASAIDSLEGTAQSIYEWFYVRGGE